MTDVLVLADHEQGVPKRLAKQLVTAAADLSGGGSVEVVLAGQGAADAAGGLGAFGAQRAFVLDDAAVDDHDTEPRTAALVAALEQSQARLLLYPAEPFASDVVARAAVRVGAGVIGDATGVDADGDSPVVTKPIFGGEMTSRCTVNGDRPLFVGIKPNAYSAEESGGEPPEIVALDVELDDKAKRVTVVDVVEEGGGDRPEMTEAPIVVAGGRGLGDAAGFELVEQLADALGGAVGASRAATDAGWYPHQHQIGQTGKTVAPQLYLGIGISGAIQHRAGMQTSQRIVAINKDSEAPIFSIADLAVVGDLYKVLPPLVDEISKREQ